MQKKCINYIGFITLCHLATVNEAIAQIIPDNTLPVNSAVVEGCTSCKIDGGTIRGNNLFHSFQEFSVSTGGEAFFNNDLAIQNIFTRVTGGQISNINGVIKTNGNANLFLLNPNGIIFGENARLNIGGSFIGTTANSINFADGTKFSAIKDASAPLLTISTPIGLNLGNNPGSITVTNRGHNFTSQSPLTPITRNNSPSGLQVQSGKTLALVGGGITLNSGVLTAISGRIELGSVVGNDTVKLNSTDSGLMLNYDGVSNFGDVQLQKISAVDASGFNEGSIQIQGRQVSLTDSSVVLIKNQGVQTAGDININATEKLTVDGVALDGKVPSDILSENLRIGDGSNINITTRSLIVENGGSIATRSYGTGNGGVINIKATELLQVNGLYSDKSRTFYSRVGSGSYATGKAGDVHVFSPQVYLSKNGLLASTNLGQGLPGSLTVDALAIKIIGGNINGTPTSISAISFGSGNAGTLTLNTRTLTLENGARVSTETLSKGSGGNITINARESISLDGFIDNRSSSITSSASNPSQFWQKLLGLPPVSSANSGYITISTPSLKISGKAEINVQNQGIGHGGGIQLNADSVLIEKLGNISASTNSGEGGNISLLARNLVLRERGYITATAGNSGNGGNISVKANTVALLKNSNISANALQGRGGNIQIAAKYLFSSPSSQITATSGIGIDGQISVSTLDVDPSQGLVELPETISDRSNQIRAGCAASNANQFIITGRSGLPASPNDLLTGGTALVSLVDFIPSSDRQAVKDAKFTANTGQTDEFVEAKGWLVDGEGSVTLVAETENNKYYSPSQPMGCIVSEPD